MCASGTADLPQLLRSSSRRRGGLLARLSCSRVGLRLPCCRASLSLLVVTTAMILAVSRFRGCISACASGTVDLLRLLRPSSRRRGRSRTPLALVCRLAPPAPSRVALDDRHHDGDESLHSRAIRGCISACTSCAIDLLRLLRSSSRRCVDSRAPLALVCGVAHPAPSRVSRVARRHDGDDSLHSRHFSVASRRLPLAPPTFLGCFDRHRDGVVDCSRASRARVSACTSRAVAHLSRCSLSRLRCFVELS